jgi:hypothetical protein
MKTSPRTAPGTKLRAPAPRARAAIFSAAFALSVAAPIAALMPVSSAQAQPPQAQAHAANIRLEVARHDAFPGIENAQDQALFVHSNSEWTAIATGTSDWIQPCPEKAGSGKTPIKLVLSLNTTPGDRKGTVVFKAKNGETARMEIVQKKADFRFDVSHKKFEISDLGRPREFRISAIKPWKIKTGANWIDIKKTSGPAGVEIIHVGAKRNATGAERTANLTVSIQGHPDKDIVVPVTQGRAGDYYNDGDVLWINKHKRGRGVPVIIVGDGFDRQDLKKGGFWEKAGRTLAENFKKVAVVRDLYEDYIDLGIYMAESPERGTGDDYGHNIKRRNNKFGGHNCAANYDLVLETLKKIPGINKNAIHACFVANGPFGGWAMGWFSFMPVTQVNDTYWIVHEFTGHILGRMPDFYNPGKEVNATEKSLADYHKDEGGLGWMLDWTNDPKKVMWKDFLKRPEYVKEGVGFYKAGYYGGLTVWAPEDFEKSPMKHYTAGFTALERYQLWKRIMWVAGEDWSTARFFKYDIPTNVGKSHIPLWKCERPPEIREWWKDIRAD